VPTPLHVVCIPDQKFPRLKWEIVFVSISKVSRRYQTEFGLRRPYAPRRRLQAMVLCITLGVVSLATIVGASTPESEPRPQVAPTVPTPKAVVETAFSTFGTPSVMNATGHSASTRDECNDLSFRFLNPKTCFNRHAKHTARHHGVANTVIVYSTPSATTTAATSAK
jgi:hypothetical protein